MASLSASSSSRREIARDIALTILLAGVGPFVIYSLLRPHTSEVRALIISALAPVLDNAISFARRRTLDVFGVFILAGILLSVVLVLFGGSPKLILIRESLLTGATGLVFLLSLLYRRPLIFYFASHFTSGGDPTKQESFAELWRIPYVRFVFRLMTAVWGIALLVESGVRSYLAFRLPTERFLAVSPFIQYGIIGATVLWTFWYRRHAQQRGAELRRQHRAAEGVASE